MSGAGRRRVTMRDVAERAGVSQPTVSLVLNDDPDARVAEATRRRIREAARELGYRPNLLARGLARRRSYALGVVVPDVSNPFFADVVSGTERVAAEEGYAVFLCETRFVSLERHLESLRGRQVDGIIMDAQRPEVLEELALEDLNVMLVDEPSERWPGIASDARAAGRLAAEHLLELGHRDVGFLGPARDTHAFRERERGFVEQLRGASVPLHSDWFRRVPPTVAGGREGMRALNALPERPTAVFCAIDLLAVGALKECLESGTEVPEGCSIMGCDDVELARLVTPELSTISVPARELGARAARGLIRRLEGGNGGAAAPGRPLPVRLRARGTTGPAPEGPMPEAA